MSLAAAADASHVWVARRPIVSIVSTGDELRYPGEAARPATVPESVSMAVAAMARRAGSVVRVAPFAPDDQHKTCGILTAAACGADLLVTIGGVSVGDHDVVRSALQSAGITLQFWRVAIKPGKPMTVGTSSSGLLVLGLPGNPTSALVTFTLFGMPFLRALQGDRRPTPPPARARLLESIVHAPGRREFVRCVLQTDGTRLTARPLTNQASGATTAMAQADALLVVPEPMQQVQQGTELDVIRLADV